MYACIHKSHVIAAAGPNRYSNGVSDIIYDAFGWSVIERSTGAHLTHVHSYVLAWLQLLSLACTCKAVRPHHPGQQLPPWKPAPLGRAAQGCLRRDVRNDGRTYSSQWLPYVACVARGIMEKKMKFTMLMTT